MKIAPAQVSASYVIKPEFERSAVVPRGPFPSFSFCLIDLERRTPEAVRAGGYVTTGQCVRTWADAR